MATKDNFEDDDIQDIDFAAPTQPPVSANIMSKAAGLNAAPQPQMQSASTQDILAQYNALKNRQNLPTQQPSSITDILSKLYGNQDAQLKQAVEDRNRTQLIANIGKGANIIAAGISRTRPDNSVYDDMLKSAGQGITDLQSQNNLHMDKLKEADLGNKLLNEQTKSDTNSDISKMSRQLAQELMPNLDVGNMSAADLEKLNPQLVSLANHRLMQEMKKISLGESKQKHTDDLVGKYSKAMGEDLDPNRARSGEMGKNQGRVNAAERIETLLNQFPDGNIPKTQTRELATSVNSLLTNGSQNAVSQINELVPHTMQGNSAAIAEWVTGNPTGMEQQQFIKLYADTARRERETAQNQILQGQFKKAYSTHHKLKDMSPDDFYQNLSTATGLDKDEIQQMEAQPGFKGQLVKSNKEADRQTAGGLKPNEVERQTADGKIAIFDSSTKKFLRYK